MLQMDTQADKLHYSGYPGDVFPKQCGAGFGFGGHGQYGTYPTGDANVIDYNVASPCGGDATLPVMPSCPPPVPVPDANRCGPENFASLSVLAPQDVGCGMGDLWADKACRLPPNHCGSQRCGDACASSGAATVENYVGDLGDAGRFAGLPADGCGAAVSDGCDSQLLMHRDPGYAGLRCSMPYSAPYHGGPGCGPSSPRLVEGMEPGPQAPHTGAPAPQLPPRPIIIQQPAPVIQVFPRISLANLFIALIIAFIVYQSLKK